LLHQRLGNPPRLDPERFAYSVLGSGAGAEFMVFTSLEEGKRFIGFELPVSQLSAAVFDQVLQSHRRTVPRGASADSLPLALRVTSPEGAVLYQTTPAPAGPFLATAHMSGSLTSLVEVSLPQSDLSLLVRGGLPGSSTAWLTAGFIGYVILLAGIGLATWRALSLARLRTDFAGTVSHELRTPLTQILLYAETLQRDQPLTVDQRRSALEAIVRETRRLVQMVENVLTVSLAGRPTPRLVYQPEEIETLVNEVLAGFAPAFRQRRVHPVVSVEGPITACCDGNAVRQILRNLVDNALRYGPEREALSILAKQDDGRLELVVEDAGPGVPANERAKIWEPFVRLEGTPGRGTGIGLSVVRQLAELHGGSARVENGTRGGSRFVVDLALEPAGRAS
jgi:signal transduction histidine kinase